MSSVFGEARAKNDVRIMREDKEYTDFRKGNIYRVLFKDNTVFLIDEKHFGFACDMELFNDEFELIRNADLNPVFMVEMEVEYYGK